MIMNNYTLLVVDDESLARESIISSIDWEKLSISRIFEAENGHEAINIIETEHPDIVILDIRMPGMNGMELLELIRERRLDVQIIVSSGYSDFEYARKMLSIGKVVDYLLKPISEDLILESVIKCIEAIETKRTNFLLKDNYISAMNMLRWQVVRGYIFGYPQEAADEPDPLPAGTLVQIALVYCAHDEENLAQVLKQEMRNSNTDLIQYFPGEVEKEYVLFFESKNAGLEIRTKCFCSRLTVETKSIIGLGRIYKNIFDLRVSYQEARLACISNIINKKSMIAIDELESQSVEAIDIDRYIQSMRSASASRDDEQVNQLLDQIFNALLVTPNKNQRIVPNDLSLIKARMAYFLEAVLIERKEWLNLSNVFNAKDIRTLYGAVKESIDLSGKLHGSDKQTYKANLMNRVKKFIEENFQRHISLDDAASIVFINPSYLSRLFSEAEGCGFSEYLTRIRINRAKELLGKRQLRIYEVAEAVGYSNAKYFIRLFKERENMTPAQYRNQHVFD